MYISKHAHTHNLYIGTYDNLFWVNKCTYIYNMYMN